MNLFDQLNQPQQEAVKTINGPLLVLAGAGSGKTRVVTYRIINLLQHEIHPSNILGLTFTNKAANEMKERVRHLTHCQVLICTFHSLGARILRESISALGYQSQFTIYDESDIDTVLNNCLLDFGVYDSKKGNKIYKNLISRAKNNMKLPSDLSLSEESKEAPKFVEIYTAYLARLKDYNALDFDDLLFLPVRLFKENPQILQNYQKQWPYLLVDEYQDTNEAQYDLIKLLVGDNCNVCVVGDPDQSIYSWRGAKIRNILNFEKDFPAAKVIRLEQNYRSRTNILEGANAVIGYNQNRYDKNLWSDMGPGQKIKHYIADTENAEAEFVAEKIKYHHRTHQIPLNHIVIFYRTNAQSRVFEDCFLKRKIPYAIVGGLSFYQRREIKDILAFLRVTQTGTDFVAFARTINIPKRGLGETTLDKIRLNAAQVQLPVLDYCKALIENAPSFPAIKLTQKQKEGIKEYLVIIHQLREVAQSGSIQNLVESAIKFSGYISHLQDDIESYDDRKANLDALISKAMEWELSAEEPTLSKFLEELSLRSSLDEKEDKLHVSLMTIHNGKGLEFTLTFLVGIEEDLFPHVNSKGALEKVEEERRLFYVGMTRAKEYLYISHTRRRFMWGVTRNQTPSRFLREIPHEYIERISLGAFEKTPEKSSTVELDKETEEKFSDELCISEEELLPGDAVFHKEFGVGIIREIYESSVGLTYKIQFSNHSKEKSLVAKYAQLVKL
jgi:DNA helicase II / ATP-dependent DNA helicase PcrA